jgi:hypothetical protein
MNSSTITSSYMHCGNCLRRGRKDKIAVGLANPWTIRVWCEKCDRLVADFALRDPLMPRCDICGEPSGPNHKH